VKGDRKTRRTRRDRQRITFALWDAEDRFLKVINPDHDVFRPRPVEDSYVWQHLEYIVGIRWEEAGHVG
jgi:hypothetical protein